MLAVVGSMNMDVVVRVPRFPQSGQTLAGTDAFTYPGGKGANQAVAAARLGADVHMFGKVGGDAFADRLIGSLQDAGVDVSAIEREAGRASGLASIWVNSEGENAIALSAGANGCVDVKYLKRHLNTICQSDVVLLQLEIPLPTVTALLAFLTDRDATVILDPAPAQDLSGLPLGRVNILTPNEHELRQISGCEAIEEGACALLERGVSHVLCTLGQDGAVWFSQDGAITHYPAADIQVVDTTGAGDALAGALAWALQTKPLDEAISDAVMAGSLAATKPGAQASLPFLKDLCERRAGR